MQNLKTLITILTIIASSHSFAKDCFEVSNKTIELKWTAFKTMGKIGVSGTFNKIKLSGPLKATNIPEIVSTTSFSIDTSSVDTKKAERDTKLKNVIFKTMSGSKITGKFLKMVKGQLLTEITMNGVTKKVPLAYKLNKNTLSAKGHIDMFDFAMGGQLSAINKACYALHKGKTWSDVELLVLAKFTACK